MPNAKWEFWIDVGGTFTDCISTSPAGVRQTTKILSSGVLRLSVKQLSPDRLELPDDAVTPPLQGYTLGHTEQGRKILVQSHENTTLVLSTPIESSNSLDTVEVTANEPAPITAIRIVTQTPLTGTLPPLRLMLGTTRGTNTLLERTGPKIGLLTTRGFGDLPLIGTQSRPDLFSLRPSNLSHIDHLTVEIDERVDTNGEVLTEPSYEQVKNELRRLKEIGIGSIAICFVNAYKNSCHESKAASLAKAEGFQFVSQSTQLSRTRGFLDRLDTCMINAYLDPVLSEYIALIVKCAPNIELELMASSGTLVPPSTFRACDSILSGPAGGVVGASRAGQADGHSKLIGFDMGGTSTDVSRYEGTLLYRYRSEKDGIRLVTPMLEIETIAAGGGSVCFFENNRLQVGPKSAASTPGPACYGAGGPLTITDVNLLAGRITDAHFPFPLDTHAAQARLDDLLAQVSTHTPNITADELLSGFLAIANGSMAQAIHRVGTEQGVSLTDHTLVSFGGAGMQHACAVADQIGVKTILYNPYSGILSAYGIGTADKVCFDEETTNLLLCEKDHSTLRAVFERQKSTTVHQLNAAITTAHATATVTHSIDCRYQGEHATLTLEFQGLDQTTVDFENLHETRFGHKYHNRPIEIVVCRTRATAQYMEREQSFDTTATSSLSNSHKLKMLSGNQRDSVPVIELSNIRPSTRIVGPAIILDKTSTIVLEPHWSISTTPGGQHLLSRVEIETRGIDDQLASPAALQVFNNRLTYIATRMGDVLHKTALSVNVKDRLDYSCAILDTEGRLIVNAPFIPVHLGAMSACVRDLIESNITINPGDVFLTNDPAKGGSHLPDLTVITPVFASPQDPKPAFFTASRAHHAEIGGRYPGSASPFARSLAEEGIVFQHFLLATKDGIRIDELRTCLTQPPYPSRSPNENIADIQAAMAANKLGADLLLALADERGLTPVFDQMNKLRRTARSATESLLGTIKNGHYRACETLDDGTELHLTLTIHDTTCIADFSNTAPVNQTCMNATPAIVESVILYCVRTMLGSDTPLNMGILEPFTFQIPESLLNPPTEAPPEARAPVFGGNTEISQKLVDLVFAALQQCAASQGTMNNIIFGNSTFGYYETLGGGGGAGKDYQGATARHCHMTNTRLTDVEILEHNYPVRLIQTAIRKGSGGAGFWSGGDGLIREYEFLCDVDLSLLTQRRTTAPYGMNGGAAGTPGRNTLIRDGRESVLAPLCQEKLKSGDRLRIETPGGGAYGAAP